MLPASWRLFSVDEVAVNQFCSTLNLHPVTARILMARGISNYDEAKLFLSPSIKNMPDPDSLPDMKKAIERLSKAIAHGEQIAIFGDYDVDGIAGTVLLAQFLETVQGSPIIMLPNRKQSGYGLSIEAVESLAAQGAQVILTVDNGTRAWNAVDRARELGIDVIITDHHDAGEKLPHAHSIVNPKLMPAVSFLKDLSGAGVAFMFAVALRRKLREMSLLHGTEPSLGGALDLVALGTIADVMPLTGINRSFTSLGLSQLERTSRIGVRALLKSSCTEPYALSPGVVAFRLAPRINAAGRMGDPHEALKLLMSSDDGEAQLIAARLEILNRERQRIEEKILSEAKKMIVSDDPVKGAIVVHAKSWHPGVIGIVAAKLAEQTGLPAIVITEETEPARGSARSGGTVDLVAALSRCEDCLVRFGGHPMAAGLTIEQNKINVFRKRFTAICTELCGVPASSSLAVDAIVSPSDITEKLVSEIEMLQPFGAGNPEPVLAIQSAQIVDRKIVGNGHLKIRIKASGRMLDGIGFDMADHLPAGISEANIAFSPQFNTWNGKTMIQIKIKNIAHV